MKTKSQLENILDWGVRVLLMLIIVSVFNCIRSYFDMDKSYIFTLMLPQIAIMAHPMSGYTEGPGSLFRLLGRSIKERQTKNPATRIIPRPSHLSLQKNFLSM